ncbi:hypothetical protein EVAR_5327_1 [Eumeta japonica]|uniref:Uncharacterized protein n=1 Tax=Eumeta variegata TaxID=151549 RepID=A0A4C1TN52_EUMVA|nr:hypothetical protein EVAR_5327_1 [Eumeta japonica]
MKKIIICPRCQTELLNYTSILLTVSAIKRGNGTEVPRPRSLSLSLMRYIIMRLHNISCTIQRTRLCRSESRALYCIGCGAYDAMRKYNAPRPFLLLPQGPILRHCDVFATNFTAAEFRALHCTYKNIMRKLNKQKASRGRDDPALEIPKCVPPPPAATTYIHHVVPHFYSDKYDKRSANMYTLKLKE